MKYHLSKATIALRQLNNALHRMRMEEGLQRLKGSSFLPIKRAYFSSSFAIFLAERKRLLDSQAVFKASRSIITTDPNEKNLWAVWFPIKELEAGKYCMRIQAGSVGLIFPADGSGQRKFYLETRAFADLKGQPTDVERDVWIYADTKAIKEDAHFYILKQINDNNRKPPRDLDMNRFSFRLKDPESEVENDENDEHLMVGDSKKRKRLLAGASKSKRGRIDCSDVL